MTVDIRPLVPDDLPELSRFLISGFHASPDAEFASPEVLRWKFLSDDRQPGPPLSYVARDGSGPIVGHVGICRTAFLGREIVGDPVETLHMIDWLGSREYRSVGSSLMRKAHASASTQFGLGGSNSGRAVIERGGYDLVGRIPVYQKVLRAGYWLRVGGLSATQRLPRLAREVARRGISLARPAPPGVPIEIRPVRSFGEEILPIAEAAAAHAILTDRSSDRLNAFLRFPGQAMTGWHLRTKDGQLCGFAILNVIPQDGGKTRIGKVVDCLLNTDDPDPWNGAINTLTHELDNQGADLAQVYAGPPWLASALELGGYTTRFALDFRLRDRDRRVPRDVPFHIMPIEADYAYT